MQIFLTDGNLRRTSPGTRLPSGYQDEMRLGVNLFAFFEGHTVFLFTSINMAGNCHVN